MCPESDSDRTERIREAQMRDRDPGRTRGTRPTTSIKKGSSVKSAVKPKNNETMSSLLTIPPGAVRDILVGLAYGLVPTIIVLLLLPGAFKLLAVLVLGVAGGTGYMLGKATP